MRELCESSEREQRIDNDMGERWPALLPGWRSRAIGGAATENCDGDRETLQSTHREHSRAIGGYNRQ